MVELTEFLGNVDEVAKEGFGDGTITMGDSFEQSSKAIRRRNGPIHHCEGLVLEE